MNQSLPVILLVFERPERWGEAVFFRLQEKFKEVFQIGETQGDYRLIMEEVDTIDSSLLLKNRIREVREDLLLVHLIGQEAVDSEFKIQIQEFQKTIFLQREKKSQFFLIHGEEEEAIARLFRHLTESVLPRSRVDDRIHTLTVRLDNLVTIEDAKHELQRTLFSHFRIENLDAFERIDTALEIIGESHQYRNDESVFIQFTLHNSEWKSYIGEFLRWFFEDFTNESKLYPYGPTFVFFLSLEYNETSPRFRRNTKQSIQKTLKTFPQITVLSELEEDKSTSIELPLIFDLLQECPKLGLIVSNWEGVRHELATKWSEQMRIPLVLGQLEDPYGEAEHEQIFEFYQLLLQQNTLNEAFYQAESTKVEKINLWWKMRSSDRRQEDWTLPFSIQSREENIPRPTVFLIFSNQKEYTHFGKELDEIRRVLEPIEMKGLSNTFFEVSYDPKKSLDKMYKAFEEYRKKTPIPIFHLGGFRDNLFFVKSIGTEKYSSDPLVSFLGRQSDLKLVFLSSSGTRDQVQQLLNAGVSAVISTYAGIEDSLAVRMASSFYQELARGNTLQVAWERTEAEAKLNFDSSQGKTKQRSITKNISIEETEAFPWGLYLREENQEDILQWRLVPKQDEDLEASSSSYQINQVLIDQIREGIATHHPAILKRIASENLVPQEVFSLLRNAFPYPIAESLRKLISPDNQALDQQRLDQLLSTYHIAIELYISILFAQLYDLKQRNPEAIGLLNPSLRSFFQIRYGIEAHQYLSLLADLQRTFSSVSKEELPFPASQQFLDQLEEDSPFLRACSRLYEIKDEWEESKMAKASFFDNKIPDFCKSAEEDLGLILKELSFLSQYVFSSVGHIFVEQHYLTGPPLYQHELVSWNSPNSPALDMRTRRQSASTLLYSQSVYLMQDLEGLEPVLPLSPLLMMIDHEPSGRSESHQLYQFSHVHPSDDEFYIKVSANPTDMIAISAESDPERYAQAEAFARVVFGCSVWKLREG